MLASLFDNLLQEIYSTLDYFVAIVNKHAKNQDYAIKKRCIKSSRKDVIIKIVIVCDAHKKTIFAS